MPVKVILNIIEMPGKVILNIIVMRGNHRVIFLNYWDLIFNKQIYKSVQEEVNKLLHDVMHYCIFFVWLQFIQSEGK